MFKGILKYYFFYVFCILSVSSLFNFTPYAGLSRHIGLAPQAQTFSGDGDSNILSQFQRFNNNSLDFNGHNLSVNNPPEKVSSFKNKLVSQRPPHQTKLKETGRIESKFLSANFSNSNNKELTRSKLIDKSNHCVFRI